MPVSAEPGFSIELPIRLFEYASFDGNYYNVSADGRHFMLLQRTCGEPGEPELHVIQNWFEEFRDREQDYGMHP